MEKINLLKNKIRDRKRDRLGRINCLCYIKRKEKKNKEKKRRENKMRYPSLVYVRIDWQTVYHPTPEDLT